MVNRIFGQRNFFPSPQNSAPSLRPWLVIVLVLVVYGAVLVVLAVMLVSMVVVIELVMMVVAVAYSKSDILVIVY